MTLNPYFSWTNEVSEQNLYHDLAEEFTQMFGIEILYLKVENLEGSNYDQLFGENRQPLVKAGVPFEVYPADIENVELGDDMFTKFGLQVDDTLHLYFPYKRFQSVFNELRPREGDLIFVQKYDDLGATDMFRISYVQKDIIFYQLGNNYFFDVKAVRHSFSHEVYEDDTLNPHGDLAINVDQQKEPENQIVNDPNTDNATIDSIKNSILNFDEHNPFGDS
jgi:hypothetical protein